MGSVEQLNFYSMRWFHIIFLIGVLATASGFRFRCFMFCTDQTAVQNDYIEQRDRCREYAQLKLDTALQESNQPDDEKNRKVLLVSLFADCMAQNGWTVPSGKDETKTAGIQAAPVSATTPFGQSTVSQQSNSTTTTTTYPVPAANASAENKAALARTAECDFARQQAGVSSIAAARAKACDYECADALKASGGEGPRPPACPSGSTPINPSAESHALDSAPVIKQADNVVSPQAHAKTTPVKKLAKKKPATVAAIVTPPAAAAPAPPPAQVAASASVAPVAVVAPQTPPSLPLVPSVAPLPAPPIPTPIPAEPKEKRAGGYGFTFAAALLLLLILGIYLAARRKWRAKAATGAASEATAKPASLFAKIRGMKRE
jgi:hypothetical protein